MEDIDKLTVVIISLGPRVRLPDAIVKEKKPDGWLVFVIVLFDCFVI